MRHGSCNELVWFGPAYNEHRDLGFSCLFEEMDKITSYLLGQTPLQSLDTIEQRVSVTTVAKLGSGSLSDVLLAMEKSTGRLVAIKVLSMNKLQSLGRNEAQVRHEVNVMRQQNHPNIVQLLDVVSGQHQLPFVDGKPPYLCIITCYIGRTESLSALIIRHGPQPKLAVDVLVQLASALASVHAKGFVHRDVWAENVLVDSAGHVLLVDFGNAEYIDGVSVIGERLNLPYMSPEAAQNHHQQCGDDTWALGLLLTEVVTGQFVSQRLGRTDIPIHAVPLALNSAIADTVNIGGPALGSLASKLLSRNAELRPSMREVIKMLSHVTPTASECTQRSSSCTAPIPKANDSGNKVMLLHSNSESKRAGLGGAQAPRLSRTLSPVLRSSWWSTADSHASCRQLQGTPQQRRTKEAGSYDTPSAPACEFPLPPVWPEQSGSRRCGEKGFYPATFVAHALGPPTPRNVETVVASPCHRSSSTRRLPSATPKVRQLHQVYTQRWTTLMPAVPVVRCRSNSTMRATLPVNVSSTAVPRVAPASPRLRVTSPTRESINSSPVLNSPWTLHTQDSLLSI